MNLLPFNPVQGVIRLYRGVGQFRGLYRTIEHYVNRANECYDRVLEWFVHRGYDALPRRLRAVEPTMIFNQIYHYFDQRRVVMINNFVSQGSYVCEQQYFGCFDGILLDFVEQSLCSADINWTSGRQRLRKKLLLALNYVLQMDLMDADEADRPVLARRNKELERLWIRVTREFFSTIPDDSLNCSGPFSSSTHNAPTTGLRRILESFVNILSWSAAIVVCPLITLVKSISRLLKALTVVLIIGCSIALGCVFAVGSATVIVRRLS